MLVGSYHAERLNKLLQKAGIHSSVKNDLLSVSITGADSMVCDILSTAAYVLGSKKGVQLIHNYSGFDSVFITSR